MKGKKYYFINVVVMAVSCLLLINYIYSKIDVINFTIEEVVICFILFSVLNIMKFFRLYIIFLEERISLKRYIKTYIKTTFVNIIIPFKLGEIFRIYCFYKETNNLKKSIIGVIIDRFIDTIALLVFLIPLDLNQNGKCSEITLLLIGFVIVSILLISMIPSTYRYLNRFFIVNSQTKGSLRILRSLEFINELYNAGRELIKGRMYLLFITSVLSWGVDFFIIQLLSNIVLGTFSISIFTDYLSSAIFQPDNIVMVHYSIMVSIEFALIGLITYPIINLNGGNNK